MPEPASRQQHSAGLKLVQRSVGLIDKAQPSDSAVVNDQFRCEGVRPQVQMRDRMRAREQRAADFPARRIAVRVQNPRAAVRGLPRESQLGSRAVEFRSPLDQLRDVLRALFYEQCHRFGPA